MKKYWHEVEQVEVDEFIRSKQTVADITDKYMQPEWCDYPDALLGVMGCWSLVGDLRTSISPDFCKDCDHCITTNPQ